MRADADTAAIAVEDFQLHPSVGAVVQFMTRNLPANELRGVARAIGVVAPAVWGQQPDEPICPVVPFVAVAECADDWPDCD